jgi:hypothetical protein
VAKNLRDGTHQDCRRFARPVQGVHLPASCGPTNRRPCPSLSTLLEESGGAFLGPCYYSPKASLLLESLTLDRNWACKLRMSGKQLVTSKRRFSESSQLFGSYRTNDKFILNAASLPKLSTLVLTTNKLVNLSDLDPLSTLPNLQTLSLLDNEVTKKPQYRLYVINRCPNLRLLDFKKIKQRVSQSPSLSTCFRTC